MLAIKNNVMASNAARHLGNSYDALSQSVERLSSGLRINSAKDDAAGMAVRELIRADIAVLEQGSRNTQDGISMLQTMEGAMAIMDENLIRMKELAEQAATGSYSNDQRAIMNAEFAEMADEIERIANSTTFNGIEMLNTSTGSVAIHVGTTDTIDIDNVDMTKSGLGITTGSAGYEAVSDSAVASAAATWLTMAGTDTDGTAKLAVQFTDSGTGDNEAAITVTFTKTAATTNFTLTQVVEAINAETLNLAVAGDGTVQAYSMASVEHNNTTGEDTLKIASRGSDATGVTATFTTIANVTGTAGFEGIAATATDVTEAEGEDTDDDGKLTKAAGTGINISTADAAATALIALTSAITTKDEARAAFGYKMNRLESTNSVLNIQAENLMTAESRISDVDVATEMAKMTRNQVLSQAGISMLSQANGMPQMALTLLR